MKFDFKKGRFFCISWATEPLQMLAVQIPVCPENHIQVSSEKWEKLFLQGIIVTSTGRVGKNLNIKNIKLKGLCRDFL